MTTDLPSAANEYTSFLRSLEQRIGSAQVQAALSVNREMVMLCWQIGCDILDCQQHGG